MPGCSGETVTVPPHSAAPPLGIRVRSVAVSSGAMTCSPSAVVQPELDPPVPTWLTPSRNDTVSPGPTTSRRKVVWPKKSSVVWVGVVGSGCPDTARNCTPG